MQGPCTLLQGLVDPGLKPPTAATELITPQLIQDAPYPALHGLTRLRSPILPAHRRNGVEDLFFVRHSPLQALRPL